MTNKNTAGSSQGVFAPEPRVYELGYLLMPTVDEGDLSTERDALVALITQYKGIAIDEAQPVLIDLAYEMEKMIANKKHSFTQGYFGWIKFDMTPEAIETLTEEVEKNANLIRFIMVKTVRENTLTSEQPFRLAKSIRDLGDDTEESDDEFISDDTEVSDDLTKIEGIGPVIAKTLSEGGIASYAALADADDEEVQEIIKDVRGNHDGTTWNEQAALARDGKWDELKALQESLRGGKA